MQMQHKTNQGGLAKSVTWLYLLLTIPIFAATAFATPGIVLTMKSTAVVSGESVLLSDVADVGEGDPDLISKLSGTNVGNSPQPGQTRFVGIAYIRLRLRQVGFDPDTIAFKGPNDVRITRKSRTLPVGRIRADVESAIRSRMPWKQENVTIGDIDFGEAVRLPTGKLTYEIVANRNEDFLGSTILGLHLFVDGKPFRRIWVTASISVVVDVVAVVKPLGKHQHIESEHLAVVSRDLADLPADTVRHVEDALGNRATRMIYPGTVLQTDMFDAPPLVQRGDLVKIVADSGAMTITATGVVKQQGRLGEMVRVMNTESKRVILARVTGPGAVQVDF